MCTAPPECCQEENCCQKKWTEVTRAKVKTKEVRGEIGSTPRKSKSDDMTLGVLAPHSICPFSPLTNWYNIEKVWDVISSHLYIRISIAKWRSNYANLPSSSPNTYAGHHDNSIHHPSSSSTYHLDRSCSDIFSRGRVLKLHQGDTTR